MSNYHVLATTLWSDENERLAVFYPRLHHTQGALRQRAPMSFVREAIGRGREMGVASKTDLAVGDTAL